MRNGKPELIIITTVPQLDADASAAVLALQNILQNYESLIQFYEQEHTTTSKPRTCRFSLHSAKTSSFASNIKKRLHEAARALTHHLKKIWDCLRRLRRDAEFRHVLKGKIREGLPKALKALSSVCYIASIILPVVHPAGIAVSAIMLVVAKLARKLADYYDDWHDGTLFLQTLFIEKYSLIHLLCLLHRL